MSGLVDPEELQTLLGLAGNELYPPEWYGQVATTASNLLTPLLRPDPDVAYEQVPEVREAAMALALEVWQHRFAPGGQNQAVDWTPGPFRLGRSLVSKVQGMLANHLDTEGMVG